MKIGAKQKSALHCVENIRGVKVNLAIENWTNSALENEICSLFPRRRDRKRGQSLKILWQSALHIFIGRKESYPRLLS